jgi:hypothetical protein
MVTAGIDMHLHKNGGFDIKKCKMTSNFKRFIGEDEHPVCLDIPL